MWSGKCVIIAIAVGVSIAVDASDVFCQQGSCSCGKCAFPGKDGEECYGSPFKDAQAPDTVDTGGTCRWFGCSSSRGPPGSFHCSHQYKCLCNDGYYATGGFCAATATAGCWAQGNTCKEVYDTCGNNCDFTNGPDHYKHELDNFVRESASLHSELDHKHPNHYGDMKSPTTKYPCASCLLKNGVVAKMASCLSCMRACSASYAVELAQNTSAVELTSTQNDASRPVTVAVVGLLLGGIATAFAARAVSEARAVPTLPESLLG